VLQIPAFPLPQTDLIVALRRSGKTVNIKKGQFLAPWDMEHVLAKARNCGRQARDADRARHDVRLRQSRERLPRARDHGRVGRAGVFDATHSVQLPGAAPASRRASAASSRRSRAPQSRSESTACSWKSRGSAAR
jgi:2-dehydro-3-deoxyphosphooctonate aldolase (KDO 8-P synthase)